MRNDKSKLNPVELRLAAGIAHKKANIFIAASMLFGVCAVASLFLLFFRVLHPALAIALFFGGLILSELFGKCADRKWKKVDWYQDYGGVEDGADRLRDDALTTLPVADKTPTKQHETK